MSVQATELIRRATRAAWMHIPVVLLLSMTIGGRPAHAAPSQAGQTPGEATQARAGLLESLTSSFSLEMAYVGRLLAPAAQLAVDEDVVALERPSEEPRAAAYARRYDISTDLALDIVENALAEGVDPELGFRLVRVESVFDVRARGRSGALGLTQLMPSTARAIDRSLDTEREVLDPETNLRTGFRYLRAMIERYGGDVRLGLLAYNRGEGTVDRVLRRGADPENGYSHLVLGTTS